MPAGAANPAASPSTASWGHSEPEGPSRGKGCPYGSAAGEPANRMLKVGFVCRERFSTLRELQAKLNGYVHWHSHFRLHSEPGYVSPVEFRNAGLGL